VDEAFAPQSVVLHLENDIDISRGDIIVHTGDLPKLANEFEALVCWMDSKPLQAGSRYLLQHNSRVVKAVVRDIEYKLDVNSLEKQPAPEQAQLNDVIRVTMKTSEPVALDSYNALPTNGGAILIDQTSYVTVGACMLQ
jgi:sulfate adenylyltransferase subunit 1